MAMVKLIIGALLAGLVLGAPSSTPGSKIPSDFSAEDIDSGRAIQALGQIAYDNAMARVAKATQGCTKDKLKIRKEWYVITAISLSVG